METRNFCAASVPVHQNKRQHISDGSNLQHPSFCSKNAIRVLLRSPENRHEVPSLYSTVSWYAVSGIRTAGLSTRLTVRFPVGPHLSRPALYRSSNTLRTRNTWTAMRLPTSMFLITSEWASALARLKQRQCQCKFDECARRARAWQTAKIGHTRPKTLPSMVSVIYTLLLGLEQLCERRLLKKRRDSGQMSVYLDKREKKTDLGLSEQCRFTFMEIWHRVVW
jgi:hypothetical protein